MNDWNNIRSRLFTLGTHIHLAAERGAKGPTFPLPWVYLNKQKHKYIILSIGKKYLYRYVSFLFVTFISFLVFKWFFVGLSTAHMSACGNRSVGFCSLLKNVDKQPVHMCALPVQQRFLSLNWFPVFILSTIFCAFFNSQVWRAVGALLQWTSGGC